MANPAEQLSEHESYPEKLRANQTNVATLNERRRAALAEIDNAPFSYALPLFSPCIPPHPFQSWFHVKVCLVAGVGFFTDACVYICSSPHMHHVTFYQL